MEIVLHWGLPCFVFQKWSCPSAAHSWHIDLKLHPEDYDLILIIKMEMGKSVQS